MKRVLRRARKVQKYDRAALQLARAQWLAMETRGPLVFVDTPTPVENTTQQRTILLSDPEGEARIAARLQRAHDRIHVVSSELPSG
jgi:hypothetical protein